MRPLKISSTALDERPQAFLSSAMKVTLEAKVNKSLSVSLAALVGPIVEDAKGGLQFQFQLHELHSVAILLRVSSALHNPSTSTSVEECCVLRLDNMAKGMSRCGNGK